MSSRRKKIFDLLARHCDDTNHDKLTVSARPEKIDAQYLMNTANLMPPDLLSKETAAFNKSDNAFCSMNLENIKSVLSIESNKVTPIVADKGDANASEEVRSVLEKIIDVIETDQLDPEKCGKRKNIVEEDLYLSSDTDPFQTDDEENDPNFNPQESRKKRKNFNFENNYQETDTSSNTDEKNKNARKISKKKLRREHTWKRNIIKSSRSQGKKYTNWKGKKQLARKMKTSCEEKCRMKCLNKMSEEERHKIFTEYWGLGDVNRQRDFISKYVTVVSKARTRIRKKNKHHPAELPEKNDNTFLELSNDKNSRRNSTFTYSLPKNENNKVQICKTFFLNTLSISAQVVKTVMNKTGTSGIVSEDRRGKACKNTLIDESTKQNVRDHINLFETIESHYCRQKTSRKYLPPTFNVSKMYTMYLEYCQEKNIRKTVTEAMYRTIFNRDFNLSFFQPKKDLCDICHNYDNSSLEEKLELEEDYRIHILNKNRAREIKQFEKQRAAENSSEVCCAVFDLQQVLPVPKSNVGLSYYKLKLSTYNFTVYNPATKECNCYMWNEVVGNRGASEIGSCLLLYIISQVEQGIREFSFFSDNCSGQNRNRFLYSLYSYLSQKYQIKIKHTYLEKGHTQSEGDCVHSVIERAARNIPIYTPDQWYTVVRTAKRKDPYKVVELAQENIYDLKDLEKKTCINWERDEENERVFLNKIKIVEADPRFPNTLLFKVNYDSTYKKLKLTEKGRKKIDVEIASLKLKPCYEKEISLKKLKYDHLQFLCRKGAILAPYHKTQAQFHLLRNLGSAT
ncbi:unnamed protein product [Acanthoscelides obtectus]|uniref:DUF7869 domain-containing protein n=2 Tax=Acanthoscelides obtectus TaxID=200917 RepID=A0A9P0PGM0_ACAOB|nr:unnamed protein product [Acanthoscelides obtectus]CAK1669195.1 hypothetical protein AOBTE_LOCUS26864 [Acanthoscelides obtectus]